MSASLGLPKTVLLVDDSYDVRQMVRDFLESLGMWVLEASSPAEAIRTARDHRGPLDLLLTDIEMPGMCGWDLAEKVAALRPGVRVLYMSGGTNLQDWSDSKKKVVGSYFIRKPFRLDELKAVLLTISSGLTPR